MSDGADLHEVVSRRRPDLVALLDRVLGGTATDDDVTEIQDVLVDELLEYGLDERDEHNDRGHRIEALISVVNQCRPDFR